MLVLPQHFNNEVDFEYYFNPVESVGVGTTAGPGIGTTATISNPGGGRTSLYSYQQDPYSYQIINLKLEIR